MSNYERFQEQNEAFGCMDETSKGHGKTGENMDKRIAGFNRKYGSQIDSVNVGSKETKAPNMAWVVKASKSPDIDPWYESGDFGQTTEQLANE